MRPKATKNSLNVSVVIPTYNAAQWLPKSIPKVDEALHIAEVKSAEIIIVDDGSTDDSGAVAKKIKSRYPIKLVRQENSGRFLARKLGTEKGMYDFILFIDTRIYIAPKALKFVINEIGKNPERKVWTSHVYLDKESNIYARFWDALTMLAWRKYFSSPRDYSYGIKEFDYYPKGTTCFFVPKKIIQDANEWFVENTKDLKTSNDDTLLIRHIAEKNNININPRFSCTYHARSNLKQFTKHVFHRGKVFVDGFLRRDGNRFFWPLLAFLVLSIAVPVCLILYPATILPVAGLVTLLWAVELFSALVLGVSGKDALSLFVLSPVFVVFYGLGIWNATVKLIKRKTGK
jgi:glycosyltransferase involved in cell wall biosynthesis